MQSGLIFKKRLRPVRSLAVTPLAQSDNFKIQNPPVVGWRQVLCITPSPRQSPKENKLKLVLKYMYYNVHCMHVWMYISDLKFFLSQMVQNYSELYLTVPPPHCRLPPRGMDRGFWSVVVSPAGRSQILKSNIPEDSHPNGGGIPVKVTLRLSSSCGEGCTDRMHQSGYHTAAEWRIIKMLLCEREVTTEERTGLSHFFNI